MKNPRSMTDSELAFTVKDLQEVIAIREPAAVAGTMHCPELGRYVDELRACCQEKRRRAVVKHCVVELPGDGTRPAVLAMCATMEDTIATLALMNPVPPGRVLVHCTLAEAVHAGMVAA